MQRSRTVCLYTVHTSPQKLARTLLQYNNHLCFVVLLYQGIDVEGDEHAVEQVFHQDVVDVFYLQAQDVVHVVEVVKVLCYQVLQSIAMQMTGLNRTAE